MKLSQLIPTSLISFLIGVGMMYFYGYGVVLNDYVYRDDINSMKSHVFTLIMIRENKIDVATDFLEEAIRMDKVRLADIPLDQLSDGSKKQLLMLNSLYDELAKHE